MLNHRVLIHRALRPAELHEVAIRVVAIPEAIFAKTEEVSRACGHGRTDTAFKHYVQFVTRAPEREGREAKLARAAFFGDALDCHQLRLELAEDSRIAGNHIRAAIALRVSDQNLREGIMHVRGCASANKHAAHKASRGIGASAPKRNPSAINATIGAGVRNSRDGKLKSANLTTAIGSAIRMEVFNKAILQFVFGSGDMLFHDVHDLSRAAVLQDVLTRERDRNRRKLRGVFRVVEQFRRARVKEFIAGIAGIRAAFGIQKALADRGTVELLHAAIFLHDGENDVGIRHKVSVALRTIFQRQRESFSELFIRDDWHFSGSF